jgi:predicted methyltransferase MtxX (methanogen marker protein 4)
MKIDLVKEESHVIINSLGVATGKKVQSKFVATEINSEVIRKALIEKEVCQTVESGRIFVSQSIKVIIVQLPHAISEG